MIVTDPLNWLLFLKKYIFKEDFKFGKENVVLKYCLKQQLVYEAFIFAKEETMVEIKLINI